MNQTHGMGRARLLQMRLEQNSPPDRPRMLGEYRPEPSLPIGIPIESFDAAKMAASISSRLRTISSREDDDEEQNSDPVAARHEKRSMSAPTSPYTPPIPKEPIRRGRGRAILLRARLPDYVVPGKPDDCSFPLDASPPAFFQRNEFRRRQLTEPSEALRTEIRFTGSGDEGPKESKPRVRGALNSVGSESSDMRDRAESISEEIEVENAVSQAEDAATSLDELSLNEAASEVER